MNHIVSKIQNKLTTFFTDNKALAVVESALLFPVLITLSFGIYDLGTAISLSQKVISASQISADLLTRERTLTVNEITQSLAAARLALDPYNSEDLGFDVVGVKFDEDLIPQECWRYTSENMTPKYVQSSETDGLGGEGEGLVVVTTRYTYTPYFSHTLIGTFDLEETSFVRGRKNAFIPMEGDTC